jgi:MFS family permease
MQVLLFSPFITSILALIIVKPLFGTNFDKDNTGYVVVLCSIFIIFMLFAFSVCAGLYIITFVSDRENKLRYLFNFIGLKPTAYLVGNLLYDFIPYILSTGIFIGMLYIMNLKFLYKGWDQILGIMACFGLSIITLTYLVSNIFKKSTYAFNKIGMWYMIIGLLLPMVLTLIVALAFIRSEYGLQNWQYILLVDPFFGLAAGLQYVLQYQFYKDYYSRYCERYPKDC